jgi:hypothetical protein
MREGSAGTEGRNAKQKKDAQRGIRAHVVIGELRLKSVANVIRVRDDSTLNDGHWDAS